MGRRAHSLARAPSVWDSVTTLWGDWTNDWGDAAIDWGKATTFWAGAAHFIAAEDIVLQVTETVGATRPINQSGGYGSWGQMTNDG